MKFDALARTTGKFVTDNSPAILSGLAVAGVVGTAYLTAKAAFKSARILNDSNREFDAENLQMPVKEKIRLIWRLYVPAVGTGALTIACVVGANRIGAARATALAAAFKISEQAFDEYKTKVIEKIGEKKETDIRTAVAQDQVNRIPQGSPIIYAGGTQRCFDAFSGRSFMSDLETLRQAQNTLNHAVLNNFYASLSDYYDLIGLPPTAQSDEVGWNSDKLLDCHYTGTLQDGVAMIHIEFAVVPIRGFNRLV